MLTFNHYKKNLKKDFSGKKTVKVALLGDSATQFLVQALRGCGYDFGFDLTIWEADFNQIERQIFDHKSELYSFDPEIVIIFQSTHKLLLKYNKSDVTEHEIFAQKQIELISSLYSYVNKNLNAKTIFYNFTEIDDGVFGNLANKIPSSFLYQVRRLNFELMSFSSVNKNFFICDLSSIQNFFGKKELFHSSVYVNTEMVLSIEALPGLAKRTVDLIGAIHGKFTKCLILDLDNTMWGGVIGDDGLEKIQIGTLGIGKAFSEFQYWVKKLQKRGIILAVCSKNTESIAKEPFEKHPDMILKLDDIAVFVANWDNKVDNIRKIQQILNIGFDSMVFLDDNPFERNFVRDNIPEISVPELPEDPAEYLEYLYSMNLFETVSYSSEDSKRTKQYQIESKRVEFMENFTDENEFLKKLEMVSKVEPFNRFNTPRVAQLTQRSNQFNLRTKRYTEDDIEKISDSSEHFTFTFTLEDKFGDNGLICVIILKKTNDEILFIDTWLMSCRVLKRGMENFVLNTLVNKTKDLGCQFLKGEYIPTQKNGMVKDHYKNLGFQLNGEYWLMDVTKYKYKECYIQSN